MGKNYRGRPTCDEESLRVLHLLALLLKGGRLTPNYLLTELRKRHCKGANSDNLLHDIKLLHEAGWFVDEKHLEPAVFERTLFAFQWEDSDAAKRLHEGVETKSLLAKALVDDLAKEKAVKWLILGSGTTVYAVAKEVFERGSEATGIDGISTANIFVLQEYVRHGKPKGITIEISDGTLEWDTASILMPGGGTYSRGQHAEALITGFSGLTKDAFHTGPVSDVGEKQRQLSPGGTSCKSILIPLEWKKIGEAAREVPFPAQVSDREYVLYTDESGDPNDEPHNIIRFWQNKLGDHFRLRPVGRQPA